VDLDLQSNSLKKLSGGFGICRVENLISILTLTIMSEKKVLLMSAYKGTHIKKQQIMMTNYIDK